MLSVLCRVVVGQTIICSKRLPRWLVLKTTDLYRRLLLSAVIRKDHIRLTMLSIVC